MSERIADLKSAVEDLRRRKFPDLDPGLVSEILDVEGESIDDRVEATRRITRLLDKHIEKKGK